MNLILDERLALLRKELDLQDIRVVPRGKPGRIFLEEILYALAAPVHEGHRPTYGAIIAETTLPGTAEYPVASSDLDETRRYADGRFSLIRRTSSDAFLTQLSAPLLTESDSVSLLSGIPGSMLIQALPSATLRLTTGDEVITCFDRRWSVKPLPSKHLGQIYSCAPRIFDNSDRTRVLQCILEFCVHELSSRNIGATVVWFLEPIDPPFPSLEAGRATPPLLLAPRDAPTHSMLAHLLSQSDKAMLVSHEGAVLEVGANLQPSERADGLVRPFKGTRHTSAKRYSYDESRALVFVVSEDGPVTVFSDGVAVQDFHSMPLGAEKELAKRIHYDREMVVGDTHEVRCARCGKNSIVEEVMIYGFKEDEKVGCPVCGAELYTALCWTLTARPVKA